MISPNCILSCKAGLMIFRTGNDRYHEVFPKPYNPLNFLIK